jgi:hypothetical protein
MEETVVMSLVGGERKGEENGWDRLRVVITFG